MAITAAPAMKANAERDKADAGADNVADQRHHVGDDSQWRQHQKRAKP